ncbi:MAG TPA: hypothetical protein VGC80_07165, partial [Acetobacteraceae bacterium]
MRDRRELSTIYLVLLAGLTLLPWAVLVRWPTPDARAAAFPALAFVALLFLLALGRGLTGRWDGIFIGQQNTISLNRLQLILWSLVVLPAFAVGGIANLLGIGALADASASGGLDIQIPTNLLGALGLAGASAVAGPM